MELERRGAEHEDCAGTLAKGARELLCRLEPAAAQRLLADQTFEQTLGDFAKAAADECATLGVEATQVLEHLARHPKVLCHLERLHVPDFVVATGCLADNPTCIERLDAAVAAQAQRLLARFREGPNTAHDICQKVMMKLLVPGEKPPRIATYSGQGSLQSWVRVVMVRTAINARSPRQEVELAECGSGGDAARRGEGEGEDPELVYLKKACGEHFAAALRAAVATLSAEQVALLRLHVREGLGIDRLARVWGSSRATLARRLSEIRKQLYEATRDWLGEHLDLSTSQTDSVLRFVQAEVDVSIGDVVGPAAGPVCSSRAPSAPEPTSGPESELKSDSKSSSPSESKSGRRVRS